MYQEKNREIRIFISSTFSDMDDERDYLMKFVFPEIRQACLERGVGFTEIDLRWGITEEESKDGQAVDICLEEIDRCREYPPFFIGLVGERYGWIPNKEDLSRYFEEDDHENSLYSEDKMFNSLGARYEKIREAVERGMSITELEFRYAILDHPGLSLASSAFYFRDETLTEEIYKRSLLKWDKFYEARNSPQFERLKKVKHSIIQSDALDHYNYRSVEELGSSIRTKILNYLDERFPSSEVRQSSSLQRVFRESRLQSYQPPEGFANQVLDLIQSAFDKPAGQILAIVGESGIGKSALLSYLSDENVRSKLGQDFDLAPYFVGTEEGSRTLASWQHYLYDLYGFDVSIGEKNGWELLADKLCGGPEVRKTVFLIDALDQLDAPQEDVDMLLGLDIPENVVIVFTITPNIDLVSQSNLEVVPFEEREVYDLEIRKKILNGFLHIHGKKLPDVLEQKVLDSKESFSPLYIKLLAEDLRQNARFESLSKRLDSLLAHKGPAEMFKHFIGEWDETYGKRCPGWRVSDVVGALAFSREGLLENELSEYLSIISGTVMEGQNNGSPHLIMSMIKSVLRPFTLRNDGKDTLMHQSLRYAALERCDEERVLKGLIDCFRGGLNINGSVNLDGALIQAKEPTIRQVQELPYLLLEANDYPRLVRLVCNFSFAMSAFRYGRNLEYFRWLIRLSKWEGDKGDIDESAKLPDVTQWTQFMRTVLPYFRQDHSGWGLEKVLLQVACETRKYPQVQSSAEAWIASGKCNWTWLRRKNVSSASNACIFYAPMDLGDFESIKYDEEGECLIIRSSDSVARYSLDGERLRENHLPKSRGAKEVGVCVSPAHFPEQESVDAQTLEERHAEGERTREARHAAMRQLLHGEKRRQERGLNNRTDFESRLSNALTSEDINTLANDFEDEDLFDYIINISDGVIVWLDVCDEEKSPVIYVAELKEEGGVNRRELSGHSDEPTDLIFIKDDILVSLSSKDALLWQVSSRRSYELDRIEGGKLRSCDRFLYVPDRQILFLASVDGLYGYDLNIAFKEDEDLSVCRGAVRVSEDLWASLHQDGVWLFDSNNRGQSFRLNVPEYASGIPSNLSCIFNKFVLVSCGHDLLIYNLDGTVVSRVSAREEIALYHDGKVPDFESCNINSIFVNGNLIVCAIGEEGFLHIRCDDLPPVSKLILDGQVTDVVAGKKDAFYVKYPRHLCLYEGPFAKRRECVPLDSWRRSIGASGASYFYESGNIDTVTVGILRKDGESGLREIDLGITEAQVYSVVELSTGWIAFFARQINRRTGKSGPGYWFGFDLEKGVSTTLPANLGKPVALIDGAILFQGSVDDVVGWCPSDKTIKFSGSVTEFLDNASRRPYGRFFTPFFAGSSQAGAYALIHNEARLLVNLETEKELLQWSGDLRNAEVLNVLPSGGVVVKLNRGLAFLELVTGSNETQKR